LLPDFGSEQWVPGFVLGGILFLIGLLLGRLGNKRLRAEVVRARNAGVEADILRKQLVKQHAGIQASSKTLSRFVGKLTEGVGRLNRASLDERDVNLMIADLARAVFDPDQFLLYRTGVDLSKDPETNTSDTETLTLVEQDGLGQIPPEIASVPVGEGKIGWVAAHGVEMTRKDWLDPARTEGVRPISNHTSLRLDLISPIIRHAGDKTRTLGVLCIGRPKAKQDRNAKLMLQTISNLGSIAYSHAVSLSEMKTRANYDGLTGLMIKSHFRKELSDRILEKENVVGALGIFIFDIDHFKTYNDTNGHPEGDNLLREFAKVIRANLRPEDLACRFGGEEFVIAMPGADAEATLRAAERIRAAIESHRFLHEDSQPNKTLTISGGVCAYPMDGNDGDELIRHADQALYEAKRTGRNKVLRYKAVEIGDASADPLEDFPLRFSAGEIDTIWGGDGKS
jgi:diguanylate cyclase (GGDEF)-like protein